MEDAATAAEPDEKEGIAAEASVLEAAAEAMTGKAKATLPTCAPTRDATTQVRELTRPSGSKAWKRPPPKAWTPPRA